MAQHYRECVASSKVDQAVLQKARAGDFANDPNLKTHIKCISEKIGFQGADGKFRRDVIEKKLKETIQGDNAKNAKLIETCVVANSDPQLQAFNAFKCLYTNAKINLL